VKKNSTFLKSLAVATLLLPSFLLAEDDHIAVGAAPESIEILDDFSSEEASECQEATRNGFFNNYLPISYPAASHWIMNILLTENHVQIEDGSYWELDSSDARKILYWNKEIPIVITQNRSWWSRHSYRLIEQTTGESVCATLKRGPSRDSEYTKFISIIDRNQIAVALTNSMSLLVCPDDARTFERWSEGQAIIIGNNGGWQNEAYPLLLINVNNNNFVRARQF
jgi:hypothetical protein